MLIWASRQPKNINRLIHHLPRNIWISDTWSISYRDDSMSFRWALMHLLLFPSNFFFLNFNYEQGSRLVTQRKEKVFPVVTNLGYFGLSACVSVSLGVQRPFFCCAIQMTVRLFAWINNNTSIVPANAASEGGLGFIWLVTGGGNLDCVKDLLSTAAISTVLSELCGFSYANHIIHIGPVSKQWPFYFFLPYLFFGLKRWIELHLT